MINSNKNNELLFSIDVNDNRFDKILLSASVEPAQVVLQNYFDSLNVDFNGFVLLDNALRAGDSDKRFLKFKVVDSKVKRKSEAIELRERDAIRISSNRKLADLVGVRKFTSMDSQQKYEQSQNILV